MSRPVDPAIVRFILEQVEAHGGDIGPLTARRFGVTRATASNYLNRLVHEGRLSARGRTRARAYALKPALLVSGIARLGPDTEDDEIWRRDLRPKLDHLPREVLDVCQYGFTTAVANAVDHSGGDSFTWRCRLDARSLEIAVSDNGVGVFNKLCEGLGLEDDRRAVLELAKGDVTTDKARHTGLSLFFASRMVQGFRLASGRLAYVRNEDADGRTRARTELLATPASGTLMSLRLNLSEVRPPEETYQRYTGADGRPRTEVPVAMAAQGGDPLTSRSQARRLTQGLERFGEAALDFEGAKGIGPAFVHEIFGAFGRAHPGTRLTVLGAEPAVQAMIDQARGA